MNEKNGFRLVFLQHSLHFQLRTTLAQGFELMIHLNLQ